MNFLLVSSNFLDFVSAYRNQDSFSVEMGYKQLAPIWKLLGQVKYLEATWEQMDVLYNNFSYSRTQEARINCQVRTYPGGSGKSSLAQDKWLELNNKEFSNYPTVRTLEGMCHQGNFIGITQRCKRFVEVVYSSGDITDRVIHWNGCGAKGNGQSERNLLWEVIELFLLDCVPTLSNPGQYIHRKLEKGTISSFEKLLTTKLNQLRLDKETGVNRDNDAANLLFNEVTHMYNQIDITKSKEK